MTPTDKDFPQPPRWAVRLLQRLHPLETLEEVEGDLAELYAYWLQQSGKKQADIRYVLAIFSVLPPFVKRRKNKKHSYTPASFPHFVMFRYYLLIAFRNLSKNKVYTFLNIGGLAAGMTVAMLIGLWVNDELSFNQYHQNYHRIARVMENVTYDGQVHTSWAASPPIGNALRSQYGNDFKQVLMASNPTRLILSSGEKHLLKTGYYFEPGVTEMLSLNMRYGTRSGLEDPSSILLSQTLAQIFFGTTNPVGKLLKLDNNQNVKVSGVYEDLPANSDFHDMLFIAPWRLYVSSNSWIKTNAWWQNGFQAYVQVSDKVDMFTISAKIKRVKLNQLDKEAAKEKPTIFLHPMSKWHLYSKFENGVNVGGRIQFVWLYGSIGLFVLLLACINFINLSTARSSTRAKEVGIRKTIGSFRSQLISQFLSESVVVALFAFALAIIMVKLILPFFNDVSGKQLFLLWTNPYFWLASISFTFLTGLLAGIYPAVYLSSFRPIHVLKGTFQAGRLAAIPRRVLVVVQFTISITLIIGSIIVFRQVQFGKNRPVGYSREGLVMIETPTAAIHNHFGVIKEELKKAGAIVEMSESLNPMTGVSFSANGYDWDGTNTQEEVSFATVYVDHDFGKTVGWQFKEGRDFSREFSTDSSAIVINETAAAFMGLQDPIGKSIKQKDFDGLKTYRVIGVIKDMLMESPYEPVSRTVYKLNADKGNYVNARINPAMGIREALNKIEVIFKKYNPDSPFEYQFVDEAYAQKFKDEERISRIAGFFAILAVFISCLGIFGLASFVAEQRVKEIGIRKVLGASVFQVWGLLSKDFMLLVLIAFFIATPLAYYFLSNWLESYTYRTTISWWVFAVAGTTAFIITLLTISHQAIKAALANPVKSLRSE